MRERERVLLVVIWFSCVNPVEITVSGLWK